MPEHFSRFRRTKVDNKKCESKIVQKETCKTSNFSSPELPCESVPAHGAETEDLKQVMRPRAHRAKTDFKTHRESPSQFVALHEDQVKPFSCHTPGLFNLPKVPAVAEALTPRSHAASSRQQDDGGGLSAEGRVDHSCAGQAKYLKPEKKR